LVSDEVVYSFIVHGSSKNWIEHSHLSLLLAGLHKWITGCDWTRVWDGVGEKYVGMGGIGEKKF